MIIGISMGQEICLIHGQVSLSLLYFTDPEDKEFKETIKNARKKLETPMAPTMLCKTSKKSKHGETRGKTNDFKSTFVCILEARESTRMRMEDSLRGPCCRKRGQFTTTFTNGYTKLFLCRKQ